MIARRSREGRSSCAGFLHRELKVTFADRLCALDTVTFHFMPTTQINSPLVDYFAQFIIFVCFSLWLLIRIAMIF
jgi:hypothetical protein